MAQPERHLTLLVPGLLGPTPVRDAPAMEMPSLEVLLTRAEPAPPAPRGFEAVLFDLFGVKVQTDADLPVAAVTRIADMGVIDRDWWLRADPVHLQLDRDRLLLTDAHLLGLTQHEANRLVAEIMQTYSADGWLLKAPRPDRWYLKPRAASRIVTTALADVVGRDIHPRLPRGADAKAWHTTLNEVQILLHTARVNAEREGSGQLPVNSLWFWGSGRLPTLGEIPWAGVWSREPLSLGLARLGDVPSHDRPNRYHAWAEMAAPGHHLVVLDDAHPAVVYGEAASLAAFLKRFETEWAMPLREALRTQTLGSVTLCSDSGERFRISTRHLRRWWRRRRARESFRAETAGAVP
jgi:hypothetical protein